MLTLRFRTRMIEAGMRRYTLRFWMTYSLLAAGACASEPLDEWVRRVELGNQLVETGDFDGATVAYSVALEQASAAGDDLRAGVVLQNLGRMLDRKGQLLAAEKAYLRAISTLERARVADDRLLVRAAAGLSAIYIQTGQYSKAEELIKEVLAAHPGGAGADKASLTGNLGVALARKRQFEVAERLMRQTADVCAGARDLEMREVGAVAMANLGGLQIRAGRRADAIASYREALTIMERLPNPSPSTLAVTLADYAKAVHEEGDIKTAEEAYLRAITVAKARLGPNHVVLAQLLEGYARVVRDSGKKGEARKLADAARRIQSEWDRENMTGHTVEFTTLLGSDAGT